MTDMSNANGSARLKTRVIQDFIDEEAKWGRKGKHILSRQINIGVKQIEKWLRGERLRYANLAKLAEALGKGMQEISEEELPVEALALQKKPPFTSATRLVEVKLSKESIASWTQEKERILSQAILAIIGIGCEVLIMAKRDGSLILTLKLTQEQADALVRCQSEGKLTQLGVSDVRILHQIQTSRARQTRIGLNAALAASFLCSICGLFPLYAPPIYAIGILLATASIFGAYKLKYNYILPATALALNIFALLEWPKAIGFFKAESGYEFRVGNRIKGIEKRGWGIFWPGFTDYVELKLKSPFKPGDILEIKIASAESSRSKQYIAGQNGYLLAVNPLDMDMFHNWKFEVGTHSISTYYNGKLIDYQIFELHNSNRNIPSQVSIPVKLNGVIIYNMLFTSPASSN